MWVYAKNDSKITLVQWLACQSDAKNEQYICKIVKAGFVLSGYPLATGMYHSMICFHKSPFSGRSDMVYLAGGLNVQCRRWVEWTP